MVPLKKLRIKSLLLLFLVSAIFLQLYPLDPDIPVGRYIVDRWGMDHGLPSDSINAIAQTSDGYLWLGTDAGLVRFDGQTFRVFEFSPPGKGKNRRISTLAVAGKDDLWIGHQGGLALFSDRVFSHFSRENGLSGERISTMTGDSDGNLWIGTADTYLNRFSAGQFTPFGPGQGLDGRFITSLLEDSHGFLWAATLINGLYKSNYGKFSRVEIQGLGSRHSLHALFEDRGGYLWIGTNMGLFRVKGKDTRVFTTREGLSDNRVNHITSDGDGNIWVGTVNGLNRIKASASTKPRIDSLLDNHYINYLYEDREGSLWAGTNGTALVRLREGIFTSYSTETGLTHFISCLFENGDGTVRIGTDYGKLYYFQEGKFTEFSLGKNILDLRIRTIGHDGKGNVLVGTTRSGIFQVESKQDHSFTRWPGLENTIIQVVYPDSRGNLWIGTMGKGLILKGRDKFHYYTIANGLSSNVVFNIQEDRRGNLWVATSNGVTKLIRGDIGRVEKYLQGVFSLFIYEESSGMPWVGTLGTGLTRIDGGEPKFLTSRQGLASDNIHGILEDGRQNFWMSGDTGIQKVNKEEIQKFFAGELDRVHSRIFGTSDGMKSEICSPWGGHGVIRTRKGEFWFATKKGIAVVEPGRLKIERLPPPPINIEKIEVNGKSDEQGPIPRRFRQKSNIEIFFSAATFVALDRVKFKYMLEGKDNDWHLLEPGGNRSVTYSDLPVGEYSFRVTAQNSDGVWNDEGGRLDFTVIQAPTRSGFYLVLTLGIIFVAIAGYLVRQKIHQTRTRTKKYQSSNLAPDKAEDALKKLVYLLEFDKVYREEKISMASLAGQLGITYHQLSQLINERLDKNFFDLINSYRVEEAKKRLADPAEAGRSVLSIAYDVGFNTKAAFNRVFKKYTGQTPSEFRKKHSKP